MCQILSFAAALYKTVLYFVNSEPGFLYLEVSFSEFQCASDAAMFRSSDLHWTPFTLQQEVDDFHLVAAALAGPWPLVADPSVPWLWPSCRLTVHQLLTLREKLSMGDMPYLLAWSLWSCWLSTQALFMLIGLHQRSLGGLRTPGPWWGNPMVSP